MKFFDAFFSLFLTVENLSINDAMLTVSASLNESLDLILLY